MKTTVRWLAGLAFSVVMGTTLAQPVPDAMKLYEQRCAVCHGDDASGSDRGPALSRSRSLRTRSLNEIHDIVQKGTASGMPPFPLPEDQLRALAGFIRSMNGSALDTPPAATRPRVNGSFSAGAGVPPATARWAAASLWGPT